MTVYMPGHTENPKHGLKDSLIPKQSIYATDK